MSNRDKHNENSSIREQMSLSLKESISRGNRREFWRSLEELADTERFRDYLHREFPALNASEADPQMLSASGRRNFLKLMSASMAFAGLTACTRQPDEHLVPYVKPIDGIVPGKPQFYATAMTMGGVATGLLVESHQARPTKIEGNPDHPGSKGGTDLFAQASVLQLYDPDRSQAALYLGDPRTWGDFLGDLRSALDGQRTKQGSGLRILTENITSPTFADQMKKVTAEFPQVKWHVYEPDGHNGARVGNQMAYGEFLNTVYQFDKADVVLSLDANFLVEGPGNIRYARDFIGKRRLSDGSTDMNRLYVAESTLTVTGAKSDHRLPIKASEVESLARAVAKALGISAGEPGKLSAEATKFADVAAKDLKTAAGKGIVIAGEHQPASVHAIANAINSTLGNTGTTVIHTDPIDAYPVDQHSSISELIVDMNAEKVDLLFIIGANPVYYAPPAINPRNGKEVTFLEAMKKVALRVHMGLYNDETAAQCQWHIPETHYLESWSDARAYDGTVSIIQPLIMPLYNGRSPHELLAAIINQAGRTSYELVQEYWKSRMTGDFEKSWKTALHDGFVPDSALPAKSVQLKPDFASSFAPINESKYELVFRLDPTVHDGRFANNSWLQETPKPINKVTWDNFAVISPKTTSDLGLSPNEEPYHGTASQIKIQHGGRELTLPVWVQPGQPDDTITVQLGYGRQRAGGVGSNIGFNTYSLRTAKSPWIANEGVKLEVGEGTYLLASTQEHFNIDTSGIGNDFFIPGDDLAARHIVRTASLDEYKKDPKGLHHGTHKPDREMTMYPHWEYTGYAWGMTIDMNACISCNACVVACQSENNIAVVGKELVAKGRIMHWLRIDTYFRGGTVNPDVFFQPMMCQHCENAPCEVVCPVNATVHDAEGLNVQVYNRCVGTRYCSNNCPYKVRRFNYLLYGDWDTPSLKNVRNPEVTVRTRGVMEKCTFCVQRIMPAKIEAEKDNRKVRDGEIMTACQTACPTDAIVFGDINDSESRVTRMKKEPRNYELLADLNTRPRASYLAPIRNTNSELAGSRKNNHQS